ncbi:hypothetical protein B0H10DRAFT_2213760 [Mycena sp. CBHHK59/15]|nr:hypothetical protein B0H10DRAFT_2213760 [Mycena sp. CBHHK59/15]
MANISELKNLKLEDTATTLTEIERLKAEGNALHAQGNHQDAYQKYSQAIKESAVAPADNARLAILYANRAASCLAMKEYLDAMHDGQQGWARIGTAAHALQAWEVCQHAWTSGLSCLPSGTSRPRSWCSKRSSRRADAGHAKAKATAESHITQIGSNSSMLAGMPWNRALKLAETGKLYGGELPSSGYVILNAYRDFVRGMQTLQQIVTTRKGDNMEALADLTNGILRDTRVFHAHPQFFDQLEAQVRFEARFSGAWGSGGAKQIQTEAVQRLKTAGWLPVRRALSVTIRGWMMKGFIDDNMGVASGGVEFYKRIIDVLEWGRRTWANVPSEDRGVIFEDSFLYLKKGAGSGYSLEDIAQMARDMKAETEASRRPPDWALDPGFYASFWIYPVAEALAILGWHHMQLGFRQLEGKVSGDRVTTFTQSSKYYVEAAEKYPEDDEHRPYFLAVALEALWWAGSPLRETLPLCRKIRDVMPKSAELWEFSQMSRNNRNANCKEAVLFLSDCEKKIASGKATLESDLLPSDLLERRRRFDADFEE